MSVFCTTVISGAVFDVWTGCYSSNGIALLACVAIDGYHGVSSYSWLHDGNSDSIGSTPLLYCANKGTYVSIVTCGNFVTKCTFTFQGSYTLLIPLE